MRLNNSIIKLNQLPLKRSLYLSCLLIMAGFFVSCTSSTKEGQLVNLKDQSVLQNIKSFHGADVELVESDAGNVLRFISREVNPVPTLVVYQGKHKWNLSKYKYLSMDINNPSKEDILVECRPVEEGWFGCGQIIPAGKTRTLRTFITRTDYPEHIQKAFIAMNGLPGGLVSMFFNVHPDSINRFSVVMISPEKGAQIEIKNIRGEGTVEMISEKMLNESYFPMIDSLGQFKHKDWVGKTTSVKALKEVEALELKDIEENKTPAQWNQYGGWLGGPILKATGHFRTEKIENKWWLVDPEGRLFWSHGMGTVDLDGYTTPITDREHYFENLPDTVKYKRFYGIETYNPKGYYKGKTIQVFSHYRWNAFQKFGEQWREKSIERAHTRLRSWGQNTIGGWSAPEVYQKSITPYTTTLELRSAPIEGSEGQWGKFPDPYHPSLPNEIKESIIINKASVSDPFCIGYFVDNELSWGDKAYLARAVISSPAHQPAKKVMAMWLKERYTTVEALNTAWKTSFTNWNDFLTSTQVPEIESEDFVKFTERLTTDYFRVIQKTLREVAPDKLYLGCRFDFHFYPSEDVSYNWLIKIAAQYCDVVSFNRYRYSAIDLVPADADKPVMIGEWHVGALDRGMLHFSLRFAEDQNHRAELYKHYLVSCLKNPHIVGAHWFEYIDEAVTGRFDGENYNTGFLDVCDRPYAEMVKASREIGSSMYEVRRQSH